MGRMSELSQTLDDLIRVGEDLVNVASKIKDIFAKPETEDNSVEEKSAMKQAEKKEKKKQEPEKLDIKFTDLRALLAEKSRAGHTAQVKALLQKYGAAKLSELNPNNYAAVMKEAEGFTDA